MNCVQVVKQTWLKPLMFYLKSYLIEAQCPVITAQGKHRVGQRLVYQISTAASFLVQKKVLHFVSMCEKEARARYRRRGPPAES